MFFFFIVKKLNSYTRSNHQGVIALAALIKYMDLQQVIDQVTTSKIPPLFVMLDGITDIRNIGGIARTAVCCGAQAIIIPDKGVGALNEEALKAKLAELKKGLPGTFVYYLYHQLVHATWFLGYGGGAAGEQLPVSKLYPDFKYTTVEQFLTTLKK